MRRMACKRIASSLFFLLLLASAPALAQEWVLFNAATANGPTPQGVIQVGGGGVCELQIAATAPSPGAIVTVYASIKATGTGPQASLINPTVLFSATNPEPNDPNNYVFGTCPNFIWAEIGSYSSGSINANFRVKRGP